jgi:DNA mismatch repair protein MutS2
MTPAEATTLNSLDWPVLQQALASHARTIRGALAAHTAELAQDREVVVSLYEMVREFRLLEDDGERVPIGSVQHIAPLLARVAKGAVLEGPELQQIGRTCASLEDLRLYLQDRGEFAPTLARQVMTIEIDSEMTRCLQASFDPHGDLSEQEYPELAQLRIRIRSLHQGIRNTLEELIKGDTLADVLQDRFVTQRADRYVLPIRAQARRTGIGIVHDTSRSGDTVFIEPAQVVELNNDLALADAKLRRETARILTALSRMVAKFVEPLEDALQDAVQVDLACARSGLGHALGGVLPEVGDQGVLHLIAMRHPVLVLQGIDVVANDLHLDGNRTGLVLSGPNTGGKTVALKCLGLAALLCRAGIPIPAKEGTRVDLFNPVLADIGDTQAVEEGLSTFSGHLKALMDILQAAGPGSLVLLDEIAVGTDPSQGAALAQAVLEALVETGARVATTTHYGPLKALAAVDERFDSAAVQYANGRPTFRLVTGVSGRSHAFSVAEGLGLDPALLDRARAIMPDHERALSEALDALEEQRGHAREVREALDEERQILAKRERVLAEREATISASARVLERAKANKTLERLREAEQEAKAIIKALQQNPQLRGAGEALRKVRALQGQVRPEQATSPPPSGTAPKTLKVGDDVLVLSLGGGRGTVVSAPRNGKVEVQAGAIRARVPLDSVRLVAKSSPNRPKRSSKKPKKAPRTRTVGSENDGRLRTEGNTLDLRGQRVDEAIDMADLFLDRMLREDRDSAFLLHGHGTGALKDGIRQWLRLHPARPAWRRCIPSEGGDAFTVIELR